MATVWGMDKFHYFPHDQHFILQTDQKPQVSIFKKCMAEVSHRIQRITIRSWRYNFTPEGISERENKIADDLLRVMPLELQESNAERNILAAKMINYSTIEERERTYFLKWKMMQNF